MTPLFSVSMAFRNHDVLHPTLYQSYGLVTHTPHTSHLTLPPHTLPPHTHTHPPTSHTHTLPPHTHPFPPHTVGLLPYNFLGVQAGLLLRDLQLLQVLDVRSTVSLLLAAGAIMTATLTIGRYRRTKSL